MTSSEHEYPLFLQDYGALLSHLQAQFDGTSSQYRGRRFVELVQRLVPHTSVGKQFERPALRPETNDGGVDLEASAKQGSDRLWIQSKYTLKEVDSLDNVISKFRSFEASLANGHNSPVQGDLFGKDATPVPPGRNIYMVVTSTDLRDIRRRYENSGRPSLKFYEQLEREKRLTIIQGRDLLPVLKAAYKKSHHHPSELQISFQTPCINVEEVYVGVIAGDVIARLYESFGDALFLDNIREFISTGSRVNEAITSTLAHEPEKFLARNNGITLRAADIRVVDDKTLLLQEASIVNGCQTVMSMARTPSNRSAVLTKIVKTSDSWDIAQSANFQNEIAQIDLALARYIRPQAIRSAAAKHGVGVQRETAFSILDSIYRHSVALDDVRSLFLAFFSQSPTNAISAYYTKLNQQVIDRAYQEDAGLEAIFGALFKIQEFTRIASEQGHMRLKSEKLNDLFQRFWKDEKPYYRAFVAAITACAVTGSNIYGQDGGPSYEETMGFIDGAVRTLETERDVFLDSYKNVFKALTIDLIGLSEPRDRILQQMYRNMKSAQVENVLMRADALAS